MGRVPFETEPGPKWDASRLKRGGEKSKNQQRQHQQEDALAACSRALMRSESANIPEVGMSLVLELLAVDVGAAAASSKTVAEGRQVDPTATPLE